MFNWDGISIEQNESCALPVIYFDYFTLGPILVLSNDKKKINNNNNNNNEDEDNNDHCYSIIQVIHRSLIGIVLQVMNRLTKNPSLVMKIESSESFYLESTFPQLKTDISILKIFNCKCDNRTSMKLIGINNNNKKNKYYLRNTDGKCGKDHCIFNGIPRIVDNGFITQINQLCYVTDAIGYSLDSIIINIIELNFNNICNLIRCLLEIVLILHKKQIRHNDIRLQNIIYDNQNEGLWLIDYGIYQLRS